MTAQAPELTGNGYAGIRMPHTWIAALKKRAASRGSGLSDEVRIAIALYIESNNIELPN